MQTECKVNVNRFRIESDHFVLIRTDSYWLLRTASVRPAPDCTTAGVYRWFRKFMKIMLWMFCDETYTMNVCHEYFAMSIFRWIFRWIFCDESSWWWILCDESFLFMNFICAFPFMHFVYAFHSSWTASPGELACASQQQPERKPKSIISLSSNRLQ